MLPKILVSICLLLSLHAVALAQTAPPKDMSAGPSATEPTDSSESIEQPMTGDHWTYEVRDEITGELTSTATNTITDVTPAEIAVRLQFLGKPGISYLIYDHSWNVKDNQIWKYSPNDGTGIKLPLKVGNNWSIQGSALFNTRGVSYKRSGSSKVVGQESITTGAGTFDTFKIETSSIDRNTSDPTKKFELAMTTWYAPSIDHWVKRVSKVSSNGHVDRHDSVELVEYGRR
jgi:hypothetical protein